MKYFLYIIEKRCAVGPVINESFARNNSFGHNNALNAPNRCVVLR